ncbi:folliculin-interacting protein N-terminus-domain-containing protein [Clohesyomyces aquaticus]|uniref:Folliculin-interacting protein N-terminus-domain-containing protein n=1 Tax=Clohesyomyces aquaticus TaxID=1231657 RepID=A0A1Y1YW44_9PLEO|nr:folliculin-interacting protein N-terminus-domain-containing protein [Clohesyomyces aquaticus]
MLGQFFSNRKGAGAPHPSPTTTLDSATEESHTRHLLYPETNTLYHPEGQPYPLHGASLTLGSGYDGPLPEIDLEHPRDCRIIIAQDESGPMPRSILFDSKPNPPRTESPTLPNTRARTFGSAAGGANTAGPTFGGLHARRSSLVTESTPRSPTVGGFTRVRTRGNSISSMPNIDERSQPQPNAQARTKDSMDLVNICLDCMFGNTPLNYRGNSNKLHIVPLEPRTSESTPHTPNLQDAALALGRSDGFRRRSNLAKSYTPSNLPPELPRPATDSAETISKEPRRRTIFITRMFSVTLPDEDPKPSNSSTPTPQSSLGKGNGFPFPQGGAKAGAQKFPHPPQVRKTPMYAITIILHLPVATPSSTMRPPSRPGHAKGGGHMSTSAPGHDSLGSSLDSDRRAGWAIIDSNFGVESLLSTSLNSDVDDRVDVIGQHWDVITRTLTSLQYIVHERILAQFKAADVSTPPVLQQPRNQPSRYSNKDMPVQPPRRAMRLQPNALAFHQEVKKAVERAGNRVVSGMRIPRVLTGQGKWGVWREEARWLGRWAGRREENFFFFNLLTAFLGNHTEWLNHLGPKWHKKRHREQQKSSAGENLTISNRTVIVSPDKMAARRLIFLLAAFLPSNSSALYDGASPMRPSTSASLRAYSQSPPTNMPPSRKQSLRRQIKHRPRTKQSLTNMRLQPPAQNGTSLSTLESANGRSDSAAADVPEAPQQVPEAPRHSRRSSAHSIRTSLVIPSMSDSAATTKSSTATVSEANPQSTVPVAHFTVPRTKSFGPSPEYRPESSDSLASANLMNTLQRSSTGHTSNPSTDSGNTSRWGSFMSFWSGRRESSTDHSDILQTTDDGLGNAGMGYRVSERPRSQLEQMVHELSMDQEFFGDGVDIYEKPTGNTDLAGDSSPETHPIGGSSGVTPSAARPIPERPRQFESALKLSVNEKDGVIDVDIPLPDFGSPLQSPLLGGYTSASSQHGSSYGESSAFSMPYGEPDQPVNAAGWLKQFHPDFAVQAIKPYLDLERDIKQAMSAEPTPISSMAAPSFEQGPLERWVDVCSALVADTRSFSIKRIRLRRLVKIIPTPTFQQPALTPGISGIPGRSQYGNPYSAPGTISAPTMTEIHLEEKFIEEQIMDFDATLIDAVDRVLAQSGQASRAESTSSSRSSSRRGRRDTRSGSDVGHNAEVAQVDCKGIIFDALESVVKDVTAERNVKEKVKKESREKKRSSREVLAKTATDSSLKEGIRRWLAEVE